MSGSAKPAPGYTFSREGLMSKRWWRLLTPVGQTLCVRLSNLPSEDCRTHIFNIEGSNLKQQNKKPA